MTSAEERHPQVRIARVQLALTVDSTAEVNAAARRRAHKVLAALSVTAAVVAAYDLALIAALAR